MAGRFHRRLLLQGVVSAGGGFTLGPSLALANPAIFADPPYRAETIAARLGISTAVYQKERLAARHIAALRAAGIRRIEITMLPPAFDVQRRAQVSEILRECRQQGVSIVSIHGNLKRRYDDPNEDRRRAASQFLLEEIRFAEQAGADIVVAHFGTNDRSRRTVTELLEETGGYRVRLTVETMRGGLQPYVDFVDRIGSDRFGLTVDIGHARDGDGMNPFVKKGRAGQVLSLAGKRVWHLHLHDTFRLKTKPDHRAPLHPDGIIEWGEVFSALKAIDYQGYFLFEDGRGENPERWVRLAAEFPDNFVARYSAIDARPSCK